VSLNFATRVEEPKSAQVLVDVGSVAAVRLVESLGVPSHTGVRARRVFRIDVANVVAELARDLNRQTGLARTAGAREGD
jgi:hypothetical protein